MQEKLLSKQKTNDMNKKGIILFLSLLISCATYAQKSDLQQHAEAALESAKPIEARYTFIRAYEDYAHKGQMKQSVECGVKATALYYRENLYKEAFELLRRIEQSIIASQTDAAKKSALFYLTSKERYNMYTKLHKGASAKEQLNIMEAHAQKSNDDEVKNDLLYNKAIYYYTMGQTQQGNAVFKQMADKLTASKEYDKVDEVYKTLIASGRRSGSANMVAQSYNSYMAWKDSTNALKTADQINALKKQIADNEASIAEKDSSLTTRQVIIIGLGILAAALAAALAVGAIILLRFILLTRKQKKTINMLNENNALKAKFISNISSQLSPTLQKMDARQPEVKALLDFSEHIQTLSELESTMDEGVEKEDTQMPPFCESLMKQIEGDVKKNVSLKVEAPKMSAKINKEYVSHILLHLLKNAAEYTPAEGKVALEFKKRSAHTYQFLVTNTGEAIPEEKRENIFKPFLEIKDLTTGDGLGLPICKQMAVKMNGDLEVDPEFTKGTRFMLTLHDA